MTVAESIAWLVAFAISRLPDPDHPREPFEKCCAECCGACGALIELLDRGSLTEAVWPLPGLPAYDWYSDHTRGVDPAYFEARIERKCPGHSYVNGVRQVPHG